jgi:hypothetical protein
LDDSPFSLARIGGDSSFSLSIQRHPLLAQNPTADIIADSIGDRIRSDHANLDVGLYSNIHGGSVPIIPMSKPYRREEEKEQSHREHE